jgi:hypothetical protein
MSDSDAPTDQLDDLNRRVKRLERETELIKGTFLGEDQVNVPDWDDGAHTFTVVVTPGVGTPLAGDDAWMMEDSDGEFVVVCWRPRP